VFTPDLNNALATTAGAPVVLPRGIRLKNAPSYLGMDRNLFNKEVRPCVTEVRIGKQGVAFDRLDLDVWFDDYKSRNGCPGSQPRGKDYGTKENTGAHEKGRHLAYRQTNQRATNFCQSACTDSLEEAERFLARLMEEIRQAVIYGVRPQRTFEQAAAKFVLENDHKRSLSLNLIPRFSLYRVPTSKMGMTA
jgi:hypothetical protein